MIGEFERARMNNPRHTGAADKIREALRWSTQPMSAYRIQLATGLKCEQVRKSLTQLINGGGVVSLAGPKSRVYALYARTHAAHEEPRSSGSGQIAGRITINQYRWGSTRLG